MNPKEKMQLKNYGLNKEWSNFIIERIKPIKKSIYWIEKVQALEKSYKMKSRKMETLIEEILKAVKRTDNKLEKIKEKLNKIDHRMVNIKIQQNTPISI